VVSFAVRVVCNAAASRLVGFLASKSPEEIVAWKEKAVEWWRQDRDLSGLIPLDFKIPDHIKRVVLSRGFAGRVTRRAIDEFSLHVNGTCPAYDLMLQYVHDIAGVARQEAGDGNPGAAEVMRQVQVIAAWLGNPKVKPWYYRNMDRACAKIADQLVGDYDESNRGAGEERQETVTRKAAGTPSPAETS